MYACAGRWVSRVDLGRFRKTNFIYAMVFIKTGPTLKLVYSILDKREILSTLLQFCLREEKKANLKLLFSFLLYYLFSKKPEMM